MCKTRMAVDAADPSSTRSPRTRPTQSPRTRPTQSPRPRTSQSPGTRSTPPRQTPFSASTEASASATTSSASYTGTSSSTFSTSSLSSLRDSISQNPHIYDISEIRAATNNFLAKRYSSSSSSAACWRCKLRNSDTLVFQRKFRRNIEMSQLRERLAVICRSHHVSVVKLLGASISGEHIYLVYEFINSANLTDCLRNRRNRDFTVLSTWMSRIQVAADLAHGLDYIHNKTGLDINLVHNHIKSNSIIVTDSPLNARICHFGCAQLCGEVDEDQTRKTKTSKSKMEIETEIVEEKDENSPSRSRELTRSGSGEMRFEGARGYMSPEFKATGFATLKSDVYAFGVVMLELLSGKEPLKYEYDKRRGEFNRTSLIETARAAVDGGGDGGENWSLRRWMDGRLKDSFPVDMAAKLTRLALDCVHVEADKRPDMGRVAGKISKMYIDSKNWSDSMKLPDQISVSLAPR